MTRREITDADVRRVQFLRRQGLTLREVQREMGLSPTTIVRIDRGEYQTDAAKSRRRSKRCPDCGGLIHTIPCVACQARNHQAASKAAEQ